MDTVTKYRKIVQELVERHAQYVPSHGQIEPMPIIDPHHDQYLLIDAGWDTTGRVHAVVFHVHIRDGKIWIEWDGTEGITEELIEAGVPKHDIVLAFYRPERRVQTEYAVG